MAEAFFFLDVIEEEVNIEEEEEDDRRRMTAVMKEIGHSVDPFSLEDRVFRKHFRLCKEAATNLVEELSPHLNAGRRVSKLTVNTRVLCALQFFASGSYQKIIGNNIFAAISQPSVSRCIQDVSSAMQRIANKWICFPNTDEQGNQIKIKFSETHGMENIVGLVDGTHISIVKPSFEEKLQNGVWVKIRDPNIEKQFVNRKSYHSINTQIVCDADMKILSINPKFPGSTHDSFIWRNSHIKNTMRTNYLNGDTESMILGDSGYPLQPWLFTPVANAEAGSSEERYNYAFIRTRSLVERTIGLLKARFRCLLKHRTLHYLPRRCA